MEKDFPLIEVNEELGKEKIFSNNEEIDLDFGQTKIKITRRIKIILIFLIFISIIIAFILILKFVILKEDDDDEDKKIPIIMDVDEGGDDMIAYIVAKNSKKYNILGITTVSPIHYVEDVTNIWLRFLKYMDFDEKVYKGENQPIFRETNSSEFEHDYQIDFPLTNKTFEKENAVDFMINTIKNYKEKVTLFLLAPLTNFAKAFQTDKSIINNIKEIVIMGGTKNEGNILYNRKAEYNIYMDADAANIVFNCGIKIKIFGTDVTHKVEFTDEIYENYLKYNTRSSLLAYNVMKGTFTTWGDNYLHDPVTVLYHLNNDIITLKDYYCYVNTSMPDVYNTDYGTIHFFEPDENNKANIEYSENINLNLYWDTLNKYIKKY